MKEEKSFWEKLKRWIDGDEVLLDADEIISKKEKKEFIYEERIFPIGDIRSNVTLYCVLSVFVTVVFIAVMLHVVMELPMFGDPNSITNNEVAALPGKRDCGNRRNQLCCRHDSGLPCL